MNYDESVRALMALGRELGAPQQARVQKFRPRKHHDSRRQISAIRNCPRPACTSPEQTAKAPRPRCSNRFLRAAGFRTGLYTSPHLERINERIRIDGEDISDEDFAAAWTRVHAAIESLIGVRQARRASHFFRMRYRDGISRVRRRTTSILRSTKWAWEGGSTRPTSCSRKWRSITSDRFRSREFSRPFDRGNCRRKSRDHQAGRMGCEFGGTARSARGDRAELQGARCTACGS